MPDEAARIVVFDSVNESDDIGKEGKAEICALVERSL